MAKKTEWLQMSQRQRMSPFPNYLSMECICKEMKQVIGYAYKQIIIIFQNNNFYVFTDTPGHRYVGLGVLKRVMKESDIFIRFAKLIKGYAKSFFKFIKTQNKKNYLAKVPNSKLASFFEEYEKRYKQLYSTYFPVLSMENYLFEYLRDYIFSKVKNEKEAGKYLNTLITEYSAMVNRQELMAALKLAVKISKRAKWVNYFKLRKIDKIIEKVKQDKELYKLIKSHERKFFWLTRDYDDPILTFNDFIERFKKHLSSNPKKELKKLEDEEVKVRKEQKRLVKELGIEKKIARLFQTMREGMYYKELRKSIVSQTLYYFDPILMETAKRCGLTLNQVRHFKISEVRPALVQGKDFSQTLSERIKHSVWWVRNGKATVYIGKEAEKITNQFVKINHQAKMLTGMPVSPGVAKGPAKIVINPDAFHKVKKGDIIITLQATPVFSTVISLSAGMVCDGGPGITSHPATLSREAGIPCIIGAKSATKILKDGDIVEVDGTKGVMRVIKRD